MHPVFRRILLHSRRILKWETVLLFSFILTLISSQVRTGKTFHPHYSEYDLNIGFLVWLVTHKIHIAILYLYIAFKLFKRPFLLLAMFGFLEIVECLIFYDKPWFRLFDIPICCDTFELLIFVIMFYQTSRQTNE